MKNRPLCRKSVSLWMKNFSFSFDPRTLGLRKVGQHSVARSVFRLSPNPALNPVAPWAPAVAYQQVSSLGCRRHIQSKAAAMHSCITGCRCLRAGWVTPCRRKCRCYKSRHGVPLEVTVHLGDRQVILQTMMRSAQPPKSPSRTLGKRPCLGPQFSDCPLCCSVKTAHLSFLRLGWFDCMKGILPDLKRKSVNHRGEVL